MPDRRLIALAVALIAACLFYLLWGLRPATAAFVLELRATKLIALIVVGAAVGVSTVVFQTVTGNRILTPAIMGFDALFLLMQTCVIFFLGSAAYMGLLGPAKFLIETAVMIVASLALFSLLMGRGREDLHRMILVGVIFGVFFRSLTQVMQRMIDPSEFAMLQGAMFASFGTVDAGELGIATAITAGVFVALGLMARGLDVVALGRKSAIGLGLAYDRQVYGLLGLIAALVSVSTALVGPITFLGLLVSSLAHSLMRNHRHSLLLPAAGLISALILVVGQSVFERVLNLQSTLSVIIEFFGGLVFLYLVMRRRVQ